MYGETPPEEEIPSNPRASGNDPGSSPDHGKDQTR